MYINLLTCVTVVFMVFMVFDTTSHTQVLVRDGHAEAKRPGGGGGGEGGRGGGVRPSSSTLPSTLPPDLRPDAMGGEGGDGGAQGERGGASSLRIGGHLLPVETFRVAIFLPPRFHLLFKFRVCRYTKRAGGRERESESVGERA